MEGVNARKQKLLSISCGLKHSAVLSLCPKTGSVHLVSFGSTKYGQCGSGEYGPGKIKMSFDSNFFLKGKSMESVACGGAHTVVKTKNNEIFSFGLNDQGQLGVGVVGNFSSIPQKLKRFTSFKIEKVCCSEESTCVLTSNGDVFGWGRNTEGLFNTEDSSLPQSIPIPTMVSSLADPLQIKTAKVSNISLGPKTLILQNKATDQLTILG